MIGHVIKEFKLVNLDNGNSIRLDGKGTKYKPKGSENTDYEQRRSTKNFSITKIASKELEFTGSGANFLISAYNSKGIEANVKMVEYRYDNHDSKPYQYITGDFDFSDYTREKNIVKVPFNSGGLNSLLKSKLNDKFELNRLESINGKVLEPLDTNEFEVINRPLFLDSLLETNTDDADSTEIRLGQGGGFSIDFKHSIPSSITYESDDSITSSLVNQQNINDNKGLNAYLFYSNSEIDKIVDLAIDFSFQVNVLISDNLSSSYLKVSLITYEGVNLDFVSENIILDLGSIENIDNQIRNINYSQSLNILKDQSIALVFTGGAVFGSGFPVVTFGTYYVDVKGVSANISIKENSVRNDLPRRSKCVLNKDVGSRLMNIINDDETTYRSNFFKTSDFNLTGITSGKYIRGFLESNITTSIKEFLDNCLGVFNMGYNIEIVNGKETLVHEPLRYFFRSETKVKIPNQVNNVKRSVAKEFVFSTVKTGYKKPSGDNLYEEVNGLNEYNTTNEYITPITRVQKDYDIESDYRADSEGKELTLRQSIKINPTGDYRSDNTIFNLDLKDVGTNVYAERTWQDDYEEEPKNIFSPDSATGLRMTPFRNMQRHFWFLNSAFTKFTDKYIRYSSTRGNSELITKKIGEEERAENGNYQINSLENAIFVSEWIEFEYKVSSDILEQVNGFTTVEGVKIPNTYFKVEFINEFNQKEYGYLFSFKPLKQGKWKLLKAL